MRTLFLVVVLAFIVGASEARAERASVLVVKTAVAATTAAVKAVPKAPGAAWRGLKWLARHA